LNTVIPQNNPPFNISCNGLSDGVLNLSVIGANPPYSFVWSNGAITQNLLNIPASVYTVLITDSKGCTTARSFTLTEPPVLVANAGTDLIICGENSITLDADTPAIGIGFWQVVSSDGVIVFSDASSPVSQISGMGEGENILQWVISDGICSDTDLVVITKASAIEAIAGNNRRICGTEVTLNATRPEFGYGYWTALNPVVSLEDSSKAFSIAYGLDYGNNQFIWTVVNGTCRDSALVTIFRKDTLDCLDKIKLPTAFSPNFDGFNDFLVVKGLEDYPDNSIELYNRWGQLVYSKENYINDWYGLDPEGIPLPDGTYFLILKVRFINKVFNTYIDMRR
jgi:gliding motility-associated-like protein